MKTRIITIEIGGEEVCHHLGLLNVEVPVDVTDGELEELTPGFFDYGDVEPEWTLECSDGIFGDDQMDVAVISEQPTPEVATARLVRHSDGDLVLVTESQ